jgi:two-component system, sensor histidine kinase ChiS
MKYLLPLGIIFVFITCLVALPDDGSMHIDTNKITELSDKWFFKAEDNILYKNENIDTSKWALIYPHLTWTLVEEFKDYTGNGWYRLNIFINEISDLKLLIPRHYKGAQFYLNSVLVHETRPFSKDGTTPKILGRPDIVNLYAHLLRKGKNVLAIRTGALDYGGGFDGKLLIGPHNLIRAIWIKSILWNLFTTSVAIFLGFYFLLYYWKRRKEKYYLYFSGMSFFLGLWSIAFNGYISWIFDYQWVYIIFAFDGAILFFIMLINFVNSFLDFKNKITAKIFLGFYIFLVLAATIEFLIAGDLHYFVKYLYDPFMLCIIPVNIYLIILCIRGIKLKRPFANRILAGCCVFALASITSMFSLMDIVKFDPPVMEGFFLMIVVFATILASRFSKVHNDLERAHEELIKADKLKDEFMAVTSHELRTPLLGIEGITDSMLNGASGELSEETRKNLSLIMISSRRLSSLVNDILDLSKLKYSDLKLERSAVNMRQVTDIAVGFSLSVFRGKNIKVKNNITDDIPNIYGDKNRVQQIMNNLIDNAIKFTSEGEVTIYAKRTAGDFVEITVEDTGIGIPSDKFEDIFESFKQVDSSVTRKYGGFGLGLSIIKQLVELQGGNIRVESEPGKGSRFIFTLPVYLDKYKSVEAETLYDKSSTDTAQQEYAPGALNRADAGNFTMLVAGIAKTSLINKKASSQGKYVLVVDDEPINQKVLQNHLTLAGYSVKIANDGYEAMGILNEGEIPDLVLLDIMLPGISGYEVCRNIREMYTLYDLPVLMCTAKNQVTDIVTGFESGANDFLPKPFDRRELIARVNTLIILKQTINDYNASRLLNLQERMNPHFLFNAVHTIHALMHTDLEKADNGILKLAEIYRFLMEKSLSPLVDFNEEWQFVNNYLEFEKIRFPEILSYNMEMIGNFNGIKIPPLILQPLVENAIKHGLRKKSEPGKLEISAINIGGKVTLTVIDDGPGPSSEDKFSRSIGNIQERLYFCYKDSAVTLEKRGLYGAIATVIFNTKTE